MAKKQLKGAIRPRQGNKTTWETINPILEEGELALEINQPNDENKAKIGDGIKNWKDLPYSLGANAIDEEYEYAKIKATHVLVAENSWLVDSTFPGYGYRALVPIAGVQQDMIPVVSYYPEEASSGALAPVVACYNGGVEIYAKVLPGEDFYIATVMCFRNKPAGEVNFSIDFVTLANLVTTGIWNQVLNRLEC